MKMLLPLALVFLSACSAYGHKEYSCNGLPEGIRCTASRDLYEMTQGGEVATTAAVVADKRVDSKTQTTPATHHQSVSTRVTDPVLDTFVTPRLPDRPVPIRTPAQVMRIWVATWEDEKTGALIVPGYIYTEIEPRRWVIGKPESAASKQTRLFKPLEQSSKTSTQSFKE
ncbi:MAG: type IV conjugative transfer system lipoprotein TraV [Cellvibrionaceae bacterium]|nr:type IV conjugative transfer system lipoprotein TraV [Cellvibrionaceae bacterium]